MSRWKRETERERERKDSWLFRSCLLSECLSIQCDRRTSKRGNKTHPDSHRIIRIIHRLATVTIPSGPARHHNLRKAHAPSPNSGRDKLPIKLHFEKMTTTKTVPACYYIPINTILLFFVCLFVWFFFSKWTQRYYFLLVSIWSTKSVSFWNKCHIQKFDLIGSLIDHMLVKDH